MDRKGEITIFLAMILVSVCALLCGLAESVRTAGARCYLRMAADSAVDSLMAQYHRELWDKYRILGLEYDSQETLEKEMEGFLVPYMEAGNWYPMKLSKVQAEDVVTLTQGDGRYLEQEILDYMKYGLFDTDWDELDEAGAGELLETWKEGGSVNRLSDLYSAHSKEAVQLEKALENINSRLESQKEYWVQARQCLQAMDGQGFISRAGKIVKELERIPALVGTYENKADRLRGRLEESRERYEEEQGNLSQEVQDALEDEIAQYEAYVDKDGQRRQEVVRLREYAPDRISWIQDVIREAEDVMDYIDNWEPDDEDDELDEASLWEPVERRWSGYGMLSLGIEFGVKDKEKEGFLERIAGMVTGGFLELVLPEGTTVSGRKLQLDSVPSASLDGAGNQGNGLEGTGNLVSRILVGEYNIRFFQGFQKEMGEGEFYELEYLIHGGNQDRDNLAGVVSHLIALRQGLNLIHILSDPGKREEARNLALAIVGGTGILPLVSVTAFLIMTVWALGEALADVRALLDGGRVPFLKTRNQWKMSLDQLLDIGRNGRLPDGEAADDGGNGLSYKGYLRILIFGGYGTGMVYRMMDIMEVNIERGQNGFSMGRCACMVDTESTVSGKHVFFSTGLWKKQMGDREFDYETRIGASGSYMDDSRKR